WDAHAGETTEQRATRADVLYAAGYLGRDPEVIAGARAVAEKYLSDPSSVETNMANQALEIAAVNGDEDLYRRIRDRIASSPTAEMRDRFAGLLTKFRDPKLVAQTIDYTYSDQVRTQDLPRLLGRLFEN